MCGFNPDVVVALWSVVVTGEEDCWCREGGDAGDYLD